MISLTLKQESSAQNVDTDVILSTVMRSVENLNAEVENDRKRTRLTLEEITRGVNYLHALVMQTTKDVADCKNEINALRKDVEGVKRRRRDMVVSAKLNSMENQITSMSATLKYVEDHYDPPTYKESSHTAIFTEADIMELIRET